jgi:hypothetical protein
MFPPFTLNKLYSFTAEQHFKTRPKNVIKHDNVGIVNDTYTIIWERESGTIIENVVLCY